jgi:hypothetical protein
VWLEGEAAQGFACDAGITPVVTGEVHLAALDGLVRLCVELGGHGPDRCQPSRTPAEGSSGGAGPVPPTERGRAALERAIIGKAVELLSGPGGLASFLRRGLLGARLGGPSLPARRLLHGRAVGLYLDQPTVPGRLNPIGPGPGAAEAAESGRGGRLLL